MCRILSFFLLFMGLVVNALAQIDLTFDSRNVGVGESFELSCRVDNFTDVLGADLVVSWDPAVLRPRRLVNNTTIVFSDNDATFDNQEGLMLVRWLNTSGPISLPDGEAFFTIEFEEIGGNGSRSDFTIIENYPDIELQIVQEVNGELTSPNVNVTPGTITVGDAPDNTAVLITGSAQGNQNDVVTLPVSVRDFRSVIGMQLSMGWDPNFLEFVEVTDVNLQGLNATSSFGVAGVSEGRLSLTWTTPSADPIDVPDNTEIFKLRFRILGSSGSTSVSFTDNPLARRITGIVNGEQGDIGFDGRSGTVTVSGSGNGGGGGSSNCDGDGLTLYFEDASVSEGGSFCVPLRVRDFQNIDGMDMFAQWDQNVIAYSSFNNTAGIQGLNVFLQQNDRLNISFTQLETSLADDEVFMELCFDVIGSAGQQSSLRIEPRAQGGIYQGNNVLPSNRCAGTISVTTDFDVDIETFPPPCQNQENGRINITVNETGQYSFEWSIGGQVISTSEDLNNVAAGDYLLRIRDGMGGLVFERTITLQSPNAIRITSVNVTPSTNGADGAIAINVAGGQGQLSFQWSNGATTQNISGIGGGEYIVVITDESGCQLMRTIEVSGEQGGLRINVVTSDYNGFNISCHGASDGSIQASAVGGMGPYEYRWTQGASGSNAVLTNLESGIYSLEVRDAIGNTAQRSITLTQPDAISVNPIVEPDIGGNTGSIDLQAMGGVRPLRFSWNTPNNDALAFVRNLSAGVYTVTIRDENNCELTRRITVPDSDMGCFPEDMVITPNGDGRNDDLQFFCLSEFQSAALKIFDQWGSLVFDAPSYTNDWSGTSSDGSILNDGVYFYVIRARDADGDLNVFEGSITLINRLR